jgi:hypothetical protein
VPACPPGSFFPCRSTEENRSLDGSGVAIGREYYCDWLLLVKWKSRRHRRREAVTAPRQLRLVIRDMLLALHRLVIHGMVAFFPICLWPGERVDNSCTAVRSTMRTVQCCLPLAASETMTVHSSR